MRFIYKLPLRFRSLFKRDRVELELNEELRFHLEILTEEYAARGMTREEARYAALRELGGVDQIKEECRDMRRVNHLENLVQDLRYGLRMLAKNPGFAGVAILTLALGIGANSAIFTYVNAFVFRPMPIDQPDETVTVGRGGGGTVTYGDYLQWRDTNGVFSSLAAFLPYGVDVRGDVGRWHVLAEVVSENYCSVLGVKPILGRGFLPNENDRAALVSWGFWKRRLAANPNFLGQKVTINNRSFTIVGVMPEGFQGLASPWRTDFWIPLEVLGQVIPRSPHDLREAGVLIIARLKPHFTARQAQAALTLLDERLNPQLARTPRTLVVQGGGLIRSSPIWETIVPASVVLMIVVGLILLIACSNLANLLAVRATLRHGEIAIRLTLGASRGRLVRQLLTEGSLLGLLGAGTGLLLAFWSAGLLSSLIPDAISGGFAVDHPADWRVLGFTLAVTALSVIIFGLRPAFIASRPEVVPDLKNAAASAQPISRMRSIFVVAELALSMAVLIVAGLFIQSVVRLQKLDLGFDTSHQLVVEYNLPDGLNGESRRSESFREIKDRIRALAGVKSASLTQTRPLGVDNEATQIILPGHQPFQVLWRDTDAAYFSTVGIPILHGRDFDERDTQAVIISDALAHRLFPGDDPIGKQIQLDAGAAAFDIVGVAGDVRYSPLTASPPPYVYRLNTPMRTSSVFLLVQTIPDPVSLMPTISRKTQANVQTANDYLKPVLEPARSAAMLMSLLGLLAMALALVGTYGVMSYSAVQRTKEIGIRMALGADRSDVQRLMIRGGLRLALAGIGIGLIVGLGIARLTAGLLYGVQPSDPETCAAVALVIVGTGILAAYIPARRATKIDPMVALRNE